MKPVPTPETAPYWEGARAGELRIQFCQNCQRHYFYPRTACRYCASLNVKWVVVSGRARLISYVINQRPLPGAETASPVIALVELQEGPRLMTNIVDVAPLPENLPIDLLLTVVFREHAGMVLPFFKPVKDIV